jgi:hypothetical protein
MHGHPLPKLAPHKEWLLQIIAEKPDLTLRQICEHLAMD